MELGNQIKEIRQRKNLTQKQLSDLSGISMDTISKIETGENKNPTILVIRMLSDALDKIRFDIYEDIQHKNQSYETSEKKNSSRKS